MTRSFPSSWRLWLGCNRHCICGISRWLQDLSRSGTFGYLFPMAPFFELMHVAHVPVWCAERVWLALLLTIGAWGVVRLAEALGIGKRWARLLGALAYCVAPIVVDWAAVSAALLAVVFLPWVLQPLVVGSKTGSPRRAAAKSGVAIALMGGVNATVIVSALPLAVIWLLTREPGPRRRSLIGWWVVCVVLACFWWTVATLLQGKYGYNYLPYTETPTVTTSTGSVFDALRGTSFWQNFDDIGGPLIPGGWTLVTSWRRHRGDSAGYRPRSRRIDAADPGTTLFGGWTEFRRIRDRDRLWRPTGWSVFLERHKSAHGGLGPLRNVRSFLPWCPFH